MRPGEPTLGWSGVVRIGLAQAAIGGQVMLATSLLNRVMVVEYALPAALPAGLVAWHYAVQLSRPAWGHGSDRGRRRTPWVIGGMGALALGVILAVDALPWLGERSAAGYLLAVAAFTLIGAGVGAAGTSLLALLASATPPGRRAAAAAITWTMMVAGIAITAGIVGSLIEPFSLARLGIVAGGTALSCFLLALVAIWRLELPELPATGPSAERPTALRAAVRAVWADDRARRFTGFVFLSMLAYSMQDLILEPFAGLVFNLTPGESTRLSGLQHGGVLAGMILTGVAGGAGGRRWIMAGCIGSAVALVGLAMAAQAGPGWPLSATVAALGFANGVFAVAAVGAMLALAGAAGAGQEGVRMGVWGAAQAIAFGTGGLAGALAADLLRLTSAGDGEAFAVVFAIEAVLFLLAPLLILRPSRAGAPPRIGPRIGDVTA